MPHTEPQARRRGALHRRRRSDCDGDRAFLMFGTHDLPLFIATALVLNATPGVDMLFTLSRTLQHGWRTGMAAALGITAGCVVHTVAAALGLAALLAASALAFTAIKWIGAAYLLWLAWECCARRCAAPSHRSRRRHPCRNASFRAGIFDQCIESKGRTFFLALLPQSLRPMRRQDARVFISRGGIIAGVRVPVAAGRIRYRMRAFGASRVTRRL